MPRRSSSESHGDGQARPHQVSRTRDLESGKQGGDGLEDAVDLGFGVAEAG